MMTQATSSQFWLTRPFGERATQTFLGVLFAALLLVTVLHLAVPQGHPLHVNAYTVNLFGKYLSVFRHWRLRHGHVPDAPNR